MHNKFKLKQLKMIKTVDKKGLWLRISQYNFEHVVPTHLWDKVQAVFGGEDASMRAFAQKVADKKKWTLSFTRKVIQEYKKFTYLAVVGTNQVTPSKLVDELWHEHLLFTQGYRKFCEEVLEYDLNHDPSLLETSKEIGIFSAQYEDTVALYKKEFGIDAPEELWGITKFKKERVVADRDFWPREKKRTRDEEYTSVAIADGDDFMPLHNWFSISDPHAPQVHHDFNGFGGGSAGGGGSSGTFESAPAHSHTGGDHSMAVDTATNADTSDSGGASDSGGTSCSSGSSCSGSSCGGGSCGGGD
ncbi:MAG: hypothetical protein ABIO57_03985 [Candidatus Paceibacterota bacterium]